MGAQGGSAVPAPASSRKRALLARVVIYGGLLVFGLPYAFSQVLLAPIRQPTVKPPPGVEELSLTSDGLKLRAWLLPGGATERAAAVVVHGLGDSIESYLDTAMALQRRGHSVILVDLRGHGGSEGRYTTLGGLESHDVRAGMAELRRRGLTAHGQLLVGHSMGAVAVLLAAAAEPDVVGVIAEAPYDDYRTSIAHHAWIFYRIPGWVPLVPMTIALAEWRAGFDADAIDAVAAARAFRAPLLAIVDGKDPRMPEPVVRRIVEAHLGPSELWVVPGVDHVGASLHPDYWRRVTAFLERSGL